MYTNAPSAVLCKPVLIRVGGGEQRTLINNYSMRAHACVRDRWIMFPWGVGKCLSCSSEPTGRKGRERERERDRERGYLFNPHLFFLLSSHGIHIAGKVAPVITTLPRAPA